MYLIEATWDKRDLNDTIFGYKFVDGRCETKHLPDKDKTFFDSMKFKITQSKEIEIIKDKPNGNVVKS